MKSQIEAYEKGLEQLHNEVARLELIIKQKNRIIASLRRQVMILEETNRELLGFQEKHKNDFDDGYNYAAQKAERWATDTQI